MRLIVQLAGLDSLSLKVKYLITAAREGLKLSVPEGAQLIEEEAKQLVTVDTGNLRDAIHIEPLLDTPEKQLVQVAPMQPWDNKWGFDPAYARRIEYGFVGEDSMGRHYNQAAQPFMRPAFDSKQAEAAAAIKAGIYDSMDAAMSKVAGKRVA